MDVVSYEKGSMEHGTVSKRHFTPQVSLGDFSCKKTCFPVNAFIMLLYSSSNSFSISGGGRSSRVLEKTVCLPNVFRLLRRQLGI